MMHLSLILELLHQCEDSLWDHSAHYFMTMIAKATIFMILRLIGGGNDGSTHSIIEDRV
jgi:hypothetical protein